MCPPSDHPKKKRKRRAGAPSEPSASDGEPPSSGAKRSERPRAKVEIDLKSLPGMRRRQSVAPPAPPPSHAPPPPTVHELFDVDGAEGERQRVKAERERAARASVRPRPHPPRRITTPLPHETDRVAAGSSGEPSLQRLSTPLSWEAVKGPMVNERASADADLPSAPESLLEPAPDTVPPGIPPLAAAQPLLSAVPLDVLAVPPANQPKQAPSGWRTAVALALVAGSLVAVGSILGSRADDSKAAARGSGRVERAPGPSEPSPVIGSEARASTGTTPSLELDLGTPSGASSTQEPGESSPSSATKPSGEAASSGEASSPDESTPSSARGETGSSAEPGAQPAPLAPAAATPALPPFDASAAASALNGIAASVASCRKAGDPEGSATVIVRYAPSGRVTSAVVEAGPFAGTVTGGCIATRFRKALVPPFSGDYVTVKKTVTLK